RAGWRVGWDGVGLCWCPGTARGLFGYVGARPRIPYRNPIVDAATVVQELEAWFPVYAERNTSGLVAPQGHVGNIEGGWKRTASLSPAACELTVDLRISPRTSPMDAKRQFGEGIAAIQRSHPGLDLSW